MEDITYVALSRVVNIRVNTALKGQSGQSGWAACFYKDYTLRKYTVKQVVLLLYAQGERKVSNTP